MTSPEEPHTRTYSHINGPTASLLDRLAVAELCRGWPVYRDASEWMNFRSLFSDDAYVWTTWSGPKKIDDFIAISKEGKATGAFIMHRECGTLVEIGSSGRRAVGKMKATISQRFGGPGPGAGAAAGGECGEYDVDCDCRFIFFCEKAPPAPAATSPTEESTTEEEKGGEGQEAAWRIKYAKLIYEKDKVLPADGAAPPRFGEEELAALPEGYRFLGAAQRRLGYEIDEGLVAVRDAEGVGRMYAAVERWLGGGEAELFW